MVLDVALLSVLIGLVFGGRFSNLASIEVKGLALAVVAVLVQYGGQYASDAGWLELNTLGPFLFLATLLLLLAVIWLNRKNSALLLIGIGIFLNFAVIAANGGKMPVSAEGLMQAGLGHLVPSLEAETVLTHQLLTDQTRLAFLSDIFVLPQPYPRPRVFSVGDVILALGTFWFFLGGLKGHPSVTGRAASMEVRRLNSL